MSRHTQYLILAGRHCLRYWLSTLPGGLLFVWIPTRQRWVIDGGEFNGRVYITDDYGRLVEV